MASFLASVSLCIVDSGFGGNATMLHPDIRTPLVVPRCLTAGFHCRLPRFKGPSVLRLLCFGKRACVRPKTTWTGRGARAQHMLGLWRARRTKVFLRHRQHSRGGPCGPSGFSHRPRSSPSAVRRHRRVPSRRRAVVLLTGRRCWSRTPRSSRPTRSCSAPSRCTRSGTATFLPIASGHIKPWQCCSARTRSCKASAMPLPCSSLPS